VPLLLAASLLQATTANAEVRPWYEVSSAAIRRLLQVTADRIHVAFDPPTTPRPTGSTDAVFERTQHGPFDDLILAAAHRFKLDPFLLKGLIANESRLDPVRYGKRRWGRRDGVPMVISGGAVGIAQFTGPGIRAVNMLRKRRRRAGEQALTFDLRRALLPQEAIPAAAELLAYLIRRFGRDGGITAYNAGIVGGMAVSRLGFWRARRTGKLSRSGVYLLQGARFLLNVLRRTNWFREQAGLAPLRAPTARPWRARRRVRLAARDAHRRGVN